MITWFRLYPEILQDPKLRRFTTLQKWLWITAMCEASQSSSRGKLFIADGIEYTDSDLAQAAGVRADEIDKAVGFIDLCVTLNMMERHADGGVTLVNFLDRQYEKPSDRPESTRERKQKQRAKESDEKRKAALANTKNTSEIKGQPDLHTGVTGESRGVTLGHALYTDTDSDSESYTETEKELRPPQINEPVVVVVGDRNLHVYKSVLDQYKRYFSFDPNQTIMNLLHSFLDDGLQMDLLAWAMRDTAEKGKDWNYAKGTINNLFSRGIRTAEQADLADQEYKKKQRERQTGKVVQLVDKLPASVEWQREQEMRGQLSEKGKLISDDPELFEMLSNLRRSKTAGE
ncbi:DnaD domain protein [Brevibacillus choshinensis]|uniref:DnaD domain protein n=1 Tax=Brevibacillus choshinensis TaxID=54911 RepID=UPI002E216BB8|nr:DnaD domain protein [Brevibacillus choshinensis]